MSVQNFRREQREARRKTAKTATATLTNDEVENGLVVATHASVQIDLTLPAAADGNADYNCLIADGGAAAVTVICTAGFGGGGAGADTVTLAQGQMVIIYSDGDSWYYTNLTTAA